MSDATEPPALPAALAGMLQRARDALAADRAESAVQLLEQALALAPGDPAVLRQLGIALYRADERDRAVAVLRQALAAAPDDPRVNMTMGSTLVATGVPGEGLEYLRRACALDPSEAVPWCTLGVALHATGHADEARNALARAVAIDPADPGQRDTLVQALVTTGDTSRAVSVLRGTLARHPDEARAWVMLGNLKTEPLDARDAGRLREQLDRPDLAESTRIALMFTLARALEDQRDYAAAFDAVQAANALERRRVQWDRDGQRALVDAMARAFDGVAPAATDAGSGRDVIFLVSVPRSGSTLVEQILTSHPQVQGGGEIGVVSRVIGEEAQRRGWPFVETPGRLSAGDWKRLGEAYLERIGPLRAGKPRFTDKTLENWTLVGAALAMLPGARVVNVRRDPLETCFSCYRQLFPDTCEFSYDLDDLVDYYAGYERLCASWRARFPGRFLDLEYEALQADTQAQVRRLLAFCGLPFDPACLAFHASGHVARTLSVAQVRQPMRHDTARAARYGAALDPLRTRLRAAGIAFADG